MRFIFLFLVVLTVEAADAGGGRWVQVVLTAYSPLDDYTRDDENNPDRLTATGVKTGDVPYNVAADPLAIPYGHLVYIPVGLGYLDKTRPTERWFKVDDTGALLKKRTRRTNIIHIDLRYISVDSALKFGKRTAWVYVKGAASK